MSALLQTTGAVIPLYNSAPFIDELVSSIALQTHQVGRLVFVDDASTDTTKSCLEKALSAYPSMLSRSTFVHLPKNMGVSTAFNVGLSHIDCDILLFTGHDDIWLPRRVEVTVNTLLSSDATIFHSSYRCFGQAHHTVPAITSAENLIASLLFRNAIGAITVAIDLRKLGKRKACFNPRLEGAEDYDLWTSLILSEHSVCSSAEELMLYRFFNKSLSQTFDYKGDPVHIRVAESFVHSVFHALDDLETQFVLRSLSRHDSKEGEIGCAYVDSDRIQMKIMRSVRSLKKGDSSLMRFYYSLCLLLREQRNRS